MKQSKYLITVISKKALKKLASDLPVGSAQKIRERLLERLNLSFSPQYIRQVLDPDDQRKNTIIIDEAIAYRDELLKDQRNREGRIFLS